MLCSMFVTFFLDRTKRVEMDVKGIERWTKRAESNLVSGLVAQKEFISFHVSKRNLHIFVEQAAAYEVTQQWTKSTQNRANHKRKYCMKSLPTFLSSVTKWCSGDEHLATYSRNEF